MDNYGSTDRGVVASRLEKLLQTYVDEGKIPGAVAVLAGVDEELEEAVVVSVGYQDVNSRTPIGPDTIFRLYSLTKPVTSVAALLLAEEGLLDLDDAVADYIPAFGDIRVVAAPPYPNVPANTDEGNRSPHNSLPTEPALLPPTVRDLLMHTSGIGGVHVLPEGPVANLYREGRFDGRDQTLEQMADKLAAIPLLFQPGQSWRYGLSTDVLARVIEVASGRTFGEFLKEALFEPLDMLDTGFFTPPDECHRLATMYGPAADGSLRPLHGLGPAAYCAPPRLEAGGSGLVSTPRDYLRFAQMLLGQGSFRGLRLLNPGTVRTMATNQLPETLLPYRLPWPHAGRFTEGAGFGLGVRVLLDPAAASVPGSPGEYGWAGAGNTFLWVEPAKNIVSLLFTQAFPFLHTDMDVAFKRLLHEGGRRA